MMKAFKRLNLRINCVVRKIEGFGLSCGVLAAANFSTSPGFNPIIALFKSQKVMGI